MRADPRHEGKRVDGHTIGTHREHRVDRGGKRLARLQRQAVDEIDVDGRKPKPPRVVEEGLRHFDRLDTVDGRLHGRREVLHAHRQTVEAEIAQQVELFERRHARVDFDGRLAVGVDVEVRGDGVVKIGYLFRAQVGGRAAAPVVLHDLPTAGKGGAEHGELALHVAEIPGRHLALLRDDDHAPAERAALLAKRQVEVERQRVPGRRCRLCHAGAIRCGVESRVELHRGWIRRVARPGPVVLSEADRR